MNIVLVGYRGTGKSAVAELLAHALGLQTVSLDEQIQRQAGKPIPEIVAERGWPGFRDLEEEIVRTFSAQDNLVLDCGGGVIERPANIDVLRASGTVVWLRAQPQTIVRRIEGDTQRPSLTGTKSFTEEVVEVLERRTPLYQQIAHWAVDTDQLSVNQVAEAIVQHVSQ